MGTERAIEEGSLIISATAIAGNRSNDALDREEKEIHNLGVELFHSVED
jgi:hypothetical protein